MSLWSGAHCRSSLFLRLMLDTSETVIANNHSITNFNLVISVVSVFFLIVKAPVHVLRIWYPILSVIVHAGLVAIYIVSARGQAGSDMSDPQHPQPGPPWYITKSCSVAKFPSNVSYCRQAKALFAFTIIIL